MNIKLFKKGDILVIAAILAAALVCYFVFADKSSGSFAEISVDGEVLYTVDLSEAKERTEFRPNDEYGVLIVAQNGTIRFEHSDCEDKLCVNSGELKNAGDVAVCLPAKTVITVVGSDVDAVVY